MPNLRKHPYIIGGILVFVILFLLDIFALEASFTESLLGSAVIAVVAAAGYWWKEEILKRPAEGVSAKVLLSESRVRARVTIDSRRDKTCQV